MTFQQWLHTQPTNHLFPTVTFSRPLAPPQHTPLGVVLSPSRGPAVCTQPLGTARKVKAPRSPARHPGPQLANPHQSMAY